MKSVLREVEDSLPRVRNSGHSLPALVRLLEDLNERLMPITDLDPLNGELQAAGLTMSEWLRAMDLRVSILYQLMREDTAD